ncbi:MAG: MFS transporter [Burkholderiales bacterium]
MTEPQRGRLDAWFDGLWSNRDFRRLWISLTITHFGGQITFLALPLTAALLLAATPFEMGVLTALESLPFALSGLFVGVLVDRSRKLPLIIGSNIGRGLVLLAVPVAAWAGLLSMPVLYAVGFLVGAGGMVGWSAYQVFMTERVGRENLVAANSKLALSDSSAQLVGPGLAGLAIQWLTAPIAILFDALSFFFSAWLLRGIPERETDAPRRSAERRSVWQDIAEGLNQIRNTPLLRSIAWGVAAWNFLRHMFLAVIILFATQELRLSAGSIGIAWMAGGLGCIAASFAARRMNLQRGVGEVMLGGVFLTGIAWGVIALAEAGTAFTAVVLALGLLAYDFGGTLFFINYLSLRQAVTPDRLLGRVISTMIFLTVLTAPLGSLLGGALAEWTGLRTTLWIAAGSGALLGLLLLRISPIAALRALPHHGTQ